MEMVELILCVVVLCIWSTSSSLVSVFTKNSNPVVVASMVVIISTVILGLQFISKRRRDRLRQFDKKEIIKLFLPAFLGIFVYPIVYFCGIFGSSPLKANVLNYLWPIVAFLVSMIMNKHMPRMVEWISISLSFMGAFLVLLFNNKVWESGFNKNEIMPLFLALIGAFSYGIYTSIIKNRIPRINSTKKHEKAIIMPTSLRMFIMGSFASIICIPVLVVIMIIRPNYVFETTSALINNHKQFLAFIWYTVVNFTLAHSLWNRINYKDTITYTANFAYLIPVLSTVLLSFFTGTDIDFIVLIGLALVVISIILLNIKDTNGLVALLAGAILYYIFLVGIPPLDNERIVNIATTILSVAVALYVACYGSIIIRISKNYGNLEKTVDSIMIFRRSMSKINLLSADDFNHTLANNRKLDMKYEHDDCVSEINIVVSGDNQYRKNILDYYHAYYRYDKNVLSFTEWVILWLLCMIIIILAFIIHGNDVLSVCFSVSITATVLLSFYTILDYQRKTTKMVSKVDPYVHDLKKQMYMQTQGESIL